MTKTKNQNLTRKEKIELIENLAWEFNTVFHLYCYLRVILENGPSLKFNRNYFFWYISTEAYRYTLISKLFKIYDDNKNVFSLRNFIKCKIPEWDESRQYKLKEDANGEPSYEKDLEWVNLNTNPDLLKILIVRHNYIAHNNLKGFLGKNLIDSDFLLLELEKPIINGYKIFIRYADIFIPDIGEYAWLKDKDRTLKKCSEILTDLNKA